MIKTLTRYLLGLLFIAAGINHFWHTAFYLAMMPPYLPYPPALVYISGIAEFGLGMLLLFLALAGAGGLGNYCALHRRVSGQPTHGLKP